jgi:hypothetical protein
VSVAGAFFPAAALAIERSSNVYWLRRDRRELWFEARGFDPDGGGGGGWSKVASDAAWIASVGDAIALLAGDAVTAFTPVAARQLFAAEGLGEALAVARAAVVDPVARRVYVATAGAVVAVDAAGPGMGDAVTVAPIAARALALSSDRRRLYAATANAIACVSEGFVEDVVELPAGLVIGAIASSPGGLVATTVASPGAAPQLVGVNLRHGSLHVLRALPGELAGAPVVADHAGGLTLAAPDRLYRCGFDGSGLAICLAPD